MVIKVAEFTTNHMGNLNILFRMAEKAKEAGATIIKMQKKDVETFYSPEKLNSKFDSPYGSTYRDYRSIFEFELEDFKRFDAKCIELGIPWYTTIQDIPSIKFFVDNFNLPMVKIASCNSKNEKLLHTIKEAFPGKPVVISIGGTELNSVLDTVDLFNDRQIYIQQCTSTYPCPLNQLFLGNISKLKETFKDNTNVHIGYSGHEEGYIPSIIAASMGAEIIERHFCLSRHSFVHHIECSLEPNEFKEMCTLIDQVPAMTSVGFGLKESEHKFLIDGAYKGQDFLGNKATIK